MNHNPLETPLFDLLNEVEIIEVKKTNIRNCILGDVTVSELNELNNHLTENGRHFLSWKASGTLRILFNRSLARM